MAAQHYRPVTFLTVQKSQASKMTQVTKTRIKFEVNMLQNKYVKAAAALKKM